MQTKFNTVMAGASGERKATSATETLRIPASDIRPGDWLMSPRHRVLRRDRPISGVESRGIFIVLHSPLAAPLSMFPETMVDVERTT